MNNELSFNEWFISRVQQTRNVLAFGGVLAFLLASSAGLVDFGSVSRAQPSLANLALICVFLIVLIRANARNDSDPIETPFAKEAKHRFLQAWMHVWFVWLVLYVLMTFKASMPFLGITGESAQIGAIIGVNALNVAHSGYILIAYSVLNSPRGSAQTRNWSIMLWILVLCVSGLVALFCLAKPQVAASLPLFWFSLLSALLGAIALTALVGRLESKLIGLPTWAVLLLYSYGAVQPLFWTFDLTHFKWLVSASGPSQGGQVDTLHALEQSLIVVAFCLKLLLFSAVYWFAFRGPINEYLSETSGESLNVDPVDVEAEIPIVPVTAATYSNHKLEFVLKGDDARIGQIAQLMSVRLSAEECISEKLLRHIVAEANDCRLMPNEPTCERFVCLSEKGGGDVLGFMYFIYCRRYRFLFVPYLCTVNSGDAGRRARTLAADKDERCSRILVDECFTFVRKYFSECTTVLLEVDHPMGGNADDLKLRKEREARIVLFQKIAAKKDIELKIADIHYTQPPLGDSESHAADVNLPLLLMCGSMDRSVFNDRKGHLTYDEVDACLAMISESVYGRVYRDDPERRRRRMTALLAWRQNVLMNVRVPDVPLVRRFADCRNV